MRGPNPADAGDDKKRRDQAQSGASSGEGRRETYIGGAGPGSYCHAQAAQENRDVDRPVLPS